MTDLIATTLAAIPALLVGIAELLYEPFRLAMCALWEVQRVTAGIGVAR